MNYLILGKQVFGNNLSGTEFTEKLVIKSDKEFSDEQLIKAFERHIVYQYIEGVGKKKNIVLGLRKNILMFMMRMETLIMLTTYLKHQIQFLILRKLILMIIMMTNET